MDAVFAPADAIDKPRLKALSARSDAKGLFRLTGHLAALAASGSLIAVAGPTLWILPAAFVHGVILVFLFAPLHETIHRTAFRSHRLNDGVAWVCGALLVLPPAYFRAFHFAHHRHTQDPARDPELAEPKPATIGAYLRQVSGLPYWRAALVNLIRHAGGRVDAAFLAPRQRPGVRQEARTLLAVYGIVAVASLATASPAALQYWVVPALLGQPVLRLFLMAEHGGCPQVPDMLRNARTTRSTGLVRWLAWNMPYHAEHHAYPALPFHAMAKTHHLLKDRLAVTAPGYIAVHRELLAGLKAPSERPVSG